MKNLTLKTTFLFFMALSFQLLVAEANIENIEQEYKVDIQITKLSENNSEETISSSQLIVNSEKPATLKLKSVSEEKAQDIEVTIDINEK